MGDLSRADENLIAMRATEGPWVERVERLIADLRSVRQPSEVLTARECEILNTMSHGMEMGEAAELHFIALSTVQDHLMKARRKLRAKNTVHAVALAIRSGLI